MSQLSIATSDKIHVHHRDRLAIVYIRQSTPQQVERHQESTRLQYALVDHAVLLGWALPATFAWRTRTDSFIDRHLDQIMRWSHNLDRYFGQNRISNALMVGSRCEESFQRRDRGGAPGASNSDKAWEASGRRNRCRGV